MNKSIWYTYEQEKKRIDRKCLTADEYEKEIRELCKRLGI